MILLCLVTLASGYGCASGKKATQQVSCNDDNASPENAVDVIVDVTIEQDADGTWPDPPECLWHCAADFADDNGTCINSRRMACVQDAPENALSVVIDLDLAYTDAAGWEAPPVCDWVCADGFQDNDGNDTCATACDGNPCGANGVCADAGGTRACTYASCYALTVAEGPIPDGVHSIDPDGTGPEPARDAYCVDGWTWDQVGIGQFDREFTTAYEGWTALSLADLEDAATRDAFVWAYNQSGGLANLGDWAAVGNCCFTAVDIFPQFVAGNDAGNYVIPGIVNGGPASCTTSLDESAYGLFYAGVPAPFPLAASYLDGFHVTSGCTIAGNPTWFVRRSTGLADCAAIREAGLSIGDGVYLVDPDGIGEQPSHEVFCDMTFPGTTIEAIGFGRFNVAFDGWSLLSVGELSTPVVQQAFAWYYSRHGGMLNLAPGWSSSNCCFHTAGSSSDLLFGGGSQRVAPSMDGAVACNPAGGYTDEFQQFFIEGVNTEQAAPIWRDYFADKQPTLAAQCGTNNNPGFFIRRF